MKLHRLGMAICVLGCFQACMAIACRYSVRELGFVDVGGERYCLYGYVSEETPADVASMFTEISRAALRDSNITVELINTDKQRGHPAMKYVDLWRIQSFPAAVLVSPDGQSLVVPVTKLNQPFKETLRLALEGIVSSPKREEILRQITKAYGVILLIEGVNAEDNVKARKAACGAIEKIGVQMKMMASAAAEPPSLIVIGRESFSRERVLLWSLGLDADKPSTPRVAVVYGKMRWVGPLMKGEEIDETNLTGILSAIGANCECGLDMSWTRGTLLPVRWDEKMRAQAAEDLGFDPEHPMVKMEVSRMVGMSGAANRSSHIAGFSPGVPFGYRELVVEFEPASRGKVTPSGRTREDTATEANAAKPLSEATPLTKGSPLFRNAIVFSIGLCVLVLVSGMGMLLRARRR